MRVPFDPTKEWHKSVNGAVKTGNEVWFRVVLPRDFGVTCCEMLLTDIDGNDTCISMDWDNTDGIEEWWQTKLTFENPALLFYRFRYTNSWGTTYVCKGENTFEAQLNGAEKWQLTVYAAEFETPDWIKGGIIYQIFPDRFYYSGKKKENIYSDRILRDDWGALPFYEPDEKGIIRNNDFFMGDFEGITQKLPYIASLGVTCIYLNPISEAHSNHRYDTANYMQSDPLLGTAEDFQELCQEARKLGIAVIIDGVYSHTGADSIYFNKLSRYDSVGAYNSDMSPYCKWYTFKKDRDDYNCWWGIKILPETNENEPSFTEFITGENGVIDYWLSLGAKGVRLDVADELPDEFLDNVRLAVKRNDKDNYLLGEVWEDASNKISGGGRRRFLLGRQLDSVMNYPFRKAVIDFLLTSNAERFMYNVFSITQNYPPCVMHTAMNHLGTHDTERILSILSGIDCEGKSRETQAKLEPDEEALKRGISLLKLANVINYTLPGVPGIYYGDEAGLTGCKDPFNRKCFPWGEENTEILDFMRDLARLRHEYDVLKDGEFYPISATLGCIAYLRYKYGTKRILVIVNKNSHMITYRLNGDMTNMYSVSGGVKFGDGVILQANGYAILTDY